MANHKYSLFALTIPDIINENPLSEHWNDIEKWSIEKPRSAVYNIITFAVRLMNYYSSLT